MSEAMLIEDADAAQQVHSLAPLAICLVIQPPGSAPRSRTRNALLPAKCEAAKPEVDVLVAELLLAKSAASVHTQL